jgi:hypothetical protein
MTRRSLLGPAAALLVVATSGVASAQSACQRYQAELANLGRGGGSQYAEAAQRQRNEISRLAGYYSSIGCDRQQFLFFGSPPPPECGAIAARIRSMQSNYADLVGRADPYDGGEARRRQLRGLVQEACAREEAVQRQREAQQLRRREEQSLAEDDTDERPRRVGSGRTMCVRSCDGFFFPLSAEPARGGENELCQALCPGAETTAFKLPYGSDADMSHAVSLRGKPYARLANAFKFQKSFDRGCACKKDGESWAQLLQKAESMIERQPGDLVVTAAKAEELSRPKLSRAAGRAKEAATTGQKPAAATVARTLDPRAAQQAADAKAAAAPNPEEKEQATVAAAAPTASNESSGIEAQAAEAKPAVARRTGSRIDVDVTGSTRSPRLVGPNVTGGPAKKAP